MHLYCYYFIKHSETKGNENTRKQREVSSYIKSYTYFDSIRNVDDSKSPPKTCRPTSKKRALIEQHRCNRGGKKQVQRNRSAHQVRAKKGGQRREVEVSLVAREGWHDEYPEPLFGATVSLDLNGRQRCFRTFRQAKRTRWWNEHGGCRVFEEGGARRTLLPGKTWQRERCWLRARNFIHVHTLYVHLWRKDGKSRIAYIKRCVLKRREIRWKT